MSFLDDFATEQLYTASFESKTETYTGAVMTGYTWYIIGTAQCLVWYSSMAKSQVSEKYKQQVEAVAVFNYSDITFTIPEDGKVTINNKTYAVIISENIGEQNEVIQVLLKKYES